MHELGLLKSEILLKNNETEGLKETIKKLKAERIYRSKLELEYHNKINRKLQELHESSQISLDKSLDTMLTLELKRKRELLGNFILKKLSNFMQTYKIHHKTNSESLLFEIQMLVITSENIFIDKECQVQSSFFNFNAGTNTDLVTSEIGIETDEIFEQIEEISYDKKQKKPFSIMITDENQDKVLAFNRVLSDFSGEESSNESFMHNSSFEHQAANSRIKSIQGMFRNRLTEVKDTQTDDNIFLELSQKDEEELLSWMIKDRQEYLKNIQRQIFTKRNELQKVNSVFSKQKNLLGQSFNLDESKFALSFNSSFSFEASFDNEFEFLKSSGIISEEMDLKSWRDGYVHGYEKGKIDGVAIEITPRVQTNSNIQESYTETANEFIKDSFLRSRNKKMTIDPDSLRQNRKRSTKIKEFRFQRKETKHYSVKVEVRPKFIDSFLDENVKTIVKHAKMSKKMVFRTISYMYLLAVNKGPSEFDTLANFIYGEFTLKYTQKSVAVKKIIDFMSGLLKYPESPKVIIFIKLLGISHKIGLEDYTRLKQSFNFLISLIISVESSSKGIISFESNPDYKFIPTIRAIECAREALEPYLTKQKIENTITILEKRSMPDPKKINKLGIIDLEFLQETLLAEHDHYNRGILNAITKFLSPFYMHGKMLKHDMVMIIRHVNPDKFLSLFGNQPALEVLNQLCSCEKVENFITINKVLDFCFNYKVLYPHDLEEFEKCEIETEKLREGIVREIAAFHSDLKKIFDDQEKYELEQEFVYIWEERIKDLLGENSMSSTTVVVIWKLFSQEVKRLINEND